MNRITPQGSAEHVENFSCLYRKELRGCQSLWLLRLCRSAASPLSSENARKAFKLRQRKEAVNNSLLYLETLQVVFPFIRFAITVETDAGKLAFTVRP